MSAEGKRSELIWVLIRVFVGGIIAYAGLMKLIQPRQVFQVVLEGYAVFPSAWVPVIAWLLPWLEWLVGMFLFFGYAPKLTVSLLTVLTLGFLGALAAGPLFGEAAGKSCGCFGGGFQLTHRQVFLLDLLNLCFLLALLWKGKFPLSLDRWLRPSEN